MSLPVPYLVYGYVYDSGVAVVGATVSAEGSLGTGNDTTDSNGRYTINLQSYADNGDSITVSCTHNGKDDSEIFTLDISDAFKQLNLSILLSGNLIITSDSFTITMDSVEHIYFGVSKTINTYVFSDGTEEILDEGKTRDNIRLTCTQTTNAESTVSQINAIMDSLEIVTLAGILDDNINQDYYITDLDVGQGAGESHAGIYHLDITLERIEDQLPYTQL